MELSLTERADLIAHFQRAHHWQEDEIKTGLLIAAVETALRMKTRQVVVGGRCED